MIKWPISVPEFAFYLILLLSMYYIASMGIFHVFSISDSLQNIVLFWIGPIVSYAYAGVCLYFGIWKRAASLGGRIATVTCISLISILAPSAALYLVYYSACYMFALCI